MGLRTRHIFLQPLRNVSHRSKQITIDDYLGEAGSVRVTKLPASSFPEIAEAKIRRIPACSQAKFTRTAILTLDQDIASILPPADPASNALDVARCQAPLLQVTLMVILSSVKCWSRDNFGHDRPSEAGLLIFL